MSNPYNVNLTFPTGDYFPTLNTAHTKNQMEHDSYPEMYRAVFNREDRPSEKSAIRKGIRYSTIPRENIRATVDFVTNSAISGTHRLTEQSRNRYEMVRNGLNERVVRNQVENRRIKSSLTRESNSLARRMSTNGKTVAYAARPDTQEALEEVTRMVFNGERGSGTQRRIKGTDTYKQPIAVFSLLSTAVGSEKRASIREKEAINQFARNKTTVEVEIEDEEETYNVKPKFSFFSRQFNYGSALEKALPADLSGKAKAEELSEGSLEMLAGWVTTRGLIDDPLIAACLLRLGDASSLPAEEEIFLRILICQKAGIPILLHCKSCVDRTGIAAAIAYATKYLLDNGTIKAANLDTILDSVAFKELFAAHIHMALEMTRYSRNQYGFKWEIEQFPLVTFHPAVARLMPDRYLTDLRLFNSERSVPAAVIAVYGGPLLFRSLNHLFTSWCLAPQEQGIKRLAIAALRLLGTLPILAAGYVLAFAWTATISAILFAVGLALAIPSTIYFKNPVHLLLGFMLVHAYLIMPPQKVMKADVTMGELAATDRVLVPGGEALPRALLFKKSAPLVDRFPGQDAEEGAAPAAAEPEELPAVG